MKKIVFVTLVVLGISVLNAQNEKGDFEYGLNLGVNFSSVSDIAGDNSTDGRTAFNFGGSAEYYFSNRWGVKGKLIYDTKGWSNGFILNMDTQNEVVTDFNLNYLTIPIMANWHFGKTRKWYLNFGPHIGFLLNVKDSTLGLNLKDGFKSIDFGAALGIGYKFRINENLKCYIEYEEQFGFLDIFKENQADAIGNRRISINLGLLYSL